MYDNLCKYLIETFPEDFAAWLLGEPVKLDRLSPEELSSEPIRADTLIVFQGQDVILHVEFQTRPDKTMSFRMLDYFVRLYRKFPSKRIHQIVVYLDPTTSSLVYTNSFKVGSTYHKFQIIRLWEQPKDQFFASPGLLPFATLAQYPDAAAEQVLRDVAQQIEAVDNPKTRSNLTAAAATLAGLKLEKELIYKILRSDVMRESVIYQDILQMGRQEGRQEGIEEGRQEGIEEGRRLERYVLLRQVVQFLREQNIPVDRLLGIFGVTLAELGEEPENN
ncbi:MAG: Rpn family recombination-promoting nuclease/putative transposase [Cyanobacteria bacterium P01_G01_bin.54]